MDKRCTEFRQGIALFAPMKWYLEQLKWAPAKKIDDMPDAIHFGTNCVELVLDFTFSTHVLMTKPGILL